MKYLCLLHLDEKKAGALSAAEHEAMQAECAAYNEELRKGGHYVASSALEAAHTGTILRVRGGNVAITDGPYTETKEQLGGFLLMEARDLNQALHLAARLPPGRLGTIEVRPLKEPAAGPAPRKRAAAANGSPA
jgi:hypothetical protein